MEITQNEQPNPRISIPRNQEHSKAKMKSQTINTTEKKITKEAKPEGTYTEESRTGKTNAHLNFCRIFFIYKMEP